MEQRMYIYIKTLNSISLLHQHEIFFELVLWMKLDWMSKEIWREVLPKFKIIKFFFFSFKLLYMWLITFWTIFGVYSSEQPYELYQSWLSLLLWTCFKEKKAGRAGLWWLLKGTAETSHERALEGENRQKMHSWEAAGRDTARALLPAHSKNKLRSNRTYREVSQARLRGLKASKGAKKGPTVPKECSGASGATGGEAPSRAESYTNVYSWQPNSHAPALHKGYKEKGRWEAV